MTEDSEVRDYSQGGEQAAILAAFAGFGRAGRYLDIGAFDAEKLSNTRALYEAGWCGTLVEPSPALMRKLLDVYGKDSNMQLVQAVVATTNYLAPMTVSDDALSTIRASNVEKWKSQANFLGRVFIPTLTVADLARQFGPFDFVSIDSEGTSADLFLDLMRQRIMPRCVCVEHDDRVIEVQSIATQNGYKVTWANQENLVMVL